MVNYLFAGGGTAGHVNPMLAVADRVRATQSDARIIVVGTAEGLESRLVPERGYELQVIPKVPFPRRPTKAAFTFFRRLNTAIAAVTEIIERDQIDVVVGFGGYVSTPVYLAARSARIPMVIHEANAKPGLANKLGARFSQHVGVAFAGTPLRHARVVGMPLRPAIESIAQDAVAREMARDDALNTFGLDPSKRTLLVTGGSLGARRINETVRQSVGELLQTDWQVLHLVGGTPEIDDPGLPGYVQLRYLDRMELAFAVADLAISRSGSSTVSEMSAVGVPAMYVPYAVGNGEQRLNAADVVAAGGAIMVNDADFTPDWVRASAVPLMNDIARIEQMRVATQSVGVVDGTAQTVSLIAAALA